MSTQEHPCAFAWLPMLIAILILLPGCQPFRPLPGISPTPTAPTETMPGSTPTRLPTRSPTAALETATMTPIPPFALHPIARERKVGEYLLVEYPLIGMDFNDWSYAPYEAFRFSFPAELLPGIFPTPTPVPTPLPQPEMVSQQQKWLEDANRILAPFGYRLERKAPFSTLPYSLYRDSNEIAAGIRVEKILSNSPASNFILIFTNQEQWWFLHKDGIETLYQPGGGYPVHVLAPILVGERLITARLEETGGYKQQGSAVVPCEIGDPDCRPGQRYTVQMDGETIYQDIFMGDFVDFSLHRLLNWDDHWVLESDHTIVIDGKPAQEDLGRLFHWDMLGDQPVYFYANDQGTGLVYDDKPVEMPYEYIVFEGYCCGNGRYNPQIFNDRAAFFARREGVWYYVEFYPAQPGANGGT